MKVLKEEIDDLRDELRELGITHVKGQGNKYLMHREYIKYNVNDDMRYNANINILDFNVMLVLYNTKHHMSPEDIYYILEDVFFGQDPKNQRISIDEEKKKVKKSLTKLSSNRIVAASYKQHKRPNKTVRLTRLFKSNMHTSRLIQCCVKDYERYEYEAFNLLRRCEYKRYYTNVITKAEVIEGYTKIQQIRRANDYE